MENDKLAEKLFDFIEKVPRDGQEYVFSQTNMQDLIKAWLDSIKESDTSKVDYWNQKISAIIRGENKDTKENKGVSLDD